MADVAMMAAMSRFFTTITSSAALACRRVVVLASRAADEVGDDPLPSQPRDAIAVPS